MSVRRVHQAWPLMAFIALTVLTGFDARHGRLATTDWRAYFPPLPAYPRGTQLQPPVMSRRAATIVDGATARELARAGFVIGGIQYAALPGQSLASVTVLAFASGGRAQAFLRTYQPTDVTHSSVEPVRGLGDGARYVAGLCAPCGVTAPTVGLLMLRRDRAIVEILTQPANQPLVLRLGHVARGR